MEIHLKSVLALRKMKTSLPDSIATVETAKEFLKNLKENGELFHPDDNAHDIIWSCEPPTYEECERLNKLMGEIYSFVDVCELISEV